MAQTQSARDLKDLRELRDKARRHPSAASYMLWGGGAVCAVFAAALTIALAVSATRGKPVTQAAKPPAPPAIERKLVAEHEISRIRDALDALASERDRLVLRVEQLERSVGDITASIGKEKPAAAEAGAPPSVPPANVVVPPARPAKAPMAQKQAAGKQQQPQTPAQTQSRIHSTESIATRTEFAVDLGGEANLDGLRALWATIRGNHGAALESLRPLVSIREGTKSGTVELRLVAGPLANAGAAARLCAGLQASGVPCQATVFDGQRLSLR